MLNIKIILVGESPVGKTAIIYIYIHQSFDEKNYLTIDQRSLKEINVNGNRLK